MMDQKILGIRLPYVLGAAALVVVIILLSWGSITNAVGDIWTYITDADSRVRVEDMVVCSASSTCSIVHAIVYSVVFVAILLLGLMIGTLIERQFLAALQQRVGPNRIGPGGYFQPVADMIKLMFKEDIRPAQASNTIYLIAPVLKATPVLLVGAVIPFGPEISLPWFNGEWYRISLGLADVNVGALWLLAVTSLATYGIVLAGWSSSNKYAMLGGIRASAQMVSYELTMGLTIAVPIMLAQSMSIRDIIEAQAGSPINWYVFQNPLAAAILMVALVAEVNRSPFDLPEAEQELTAGYMTEYGGMKFALFMLGEYVGMIVVSMITVSLFFGGYQFWFVDKAPILAPFIMLAKTFVLVFGLVWIRGTLPRLRYDRLMMLGWKVMLPLALLAVTWTAIVLVISDEIGGNGPLWVSVGMFAALILFAWLLIDRPGVKWTQEMKEDPLITGERGGFAYGALEVLGGLVAVPFLIYNATLRALDSLTKAGQDPVRQPGSDEKTPDDKS